MTEGSIVSEGNVEIAVLVGSLRKGSINRQLAQVAADNAPQGVHVTIVEGLGELPFYSEDHDPSSDDDAILPAGVAVLRETVGAADAVLLITPEYNGTIPAVLKNAIDWASRPWGQNSFNHMPAAVIGASPGQIGTAVGQQSLRAVLGFCNARQMTAPEAYIHFRPGLFTDDGEVTDESTSAFLADYMREFRDYIERVLTVLPRR